MDSVSTLGNIRAADLICRQDTPSSTEGGGGLRRGSIHGSMVLAIHRTFWTNLGSLGR